MRNPYLFAHLLICIFAHLTMRRLIVLFTLITILWFSAIPAHALEGRASLTTVAWARENRTPPVGEDVETNLFLYEYFRLNMVNIGGQQLALHTQGRVRWNRLGEEQWDGRFYQGYFDWKPTKSINFRAGRQFLPNDVGFWQMDGVRINLNFLESISPSIYGGVSVSPWTLVSDREGVLGV